MKKALFLLAALCIANMGFAQLSYATLNHNDTMQVFTGMDALQRAHAAAVGGDIIILSSGVFFSVNITKAVSIRGAGMFNDTTRGLVNTLISGSFDIDIADSVNQLSLTGLIFNSEIIIYKAYRPLFTKCRFQTVRSYRHSGTGDRPHYQCPVYQLHYSVVEQQFVGQLYQLECHRNGILQLHYFRHCRK